MLATFAGSSILVTAVCKGVRADAGKPRGERDAGKAAIAKSVIVDNRHTRREFDARQASAEVESFR